MADVPAVSWSASVEQTDWIAERLAPFETGLLNAVVPGGFEAYARLLHLTERGEPGREVAVRWAEIAAWSEMPLRPDSQFASIALPPHEPPGAVPWDGPPQKGSLDAVGAAALVDILRRTPAPLSAAGSVSGTAMAGTTKSVRPMAPAYR